MQVDLLNCVKTRAMVAESRRKLLNDLDLVFEEDRIPEKGRCQPGCG